MERYLASRGLELADDLAGRVLRWSDDLKAFAKLFGPLLPEGALGAMVALFRDIRTDEPRAISCTFLGGEARKLGRLFKGPVGGAAIKLDADEDVLGGLHVGEGIETCLTARQWGLRPCWALGSAGAIGSFPVLDGIECLTLLAEHDENGTNAKAVEACAARWHDAGKEIQIIEPIEAAAKDLNDVVMRRARP